jgi:hypothetical protein
MKWQQQVDQLRSERRGDNYNFQGYELYGVVCTPFVVFTNREQTRIIVKREDRFLRATCGVNELADFLTD